MMALWKDAGGIGKIRSTVRQWLGRPRPAGGMPVPPAAVDKTVLLVELGGPSAAALLPPLLRSGFDARVVRSAAAALDALGRQSVVAVIVVGPAAAGLYRTLRRATAVPLLALDPGADDDHVLAAFAAGVDQFQAGPTSSDEVVARLAALLRRG
jgi:DNA-binding response OmpR family regulator